MIEPPKHLSGIESSPSSPSGYTERAKRLISISILGTILGGVGWLMANGDTANITVQINDYNYEQQYPRNYPKEAASINNAQQLQAAEVALHNDELWVDVWLGLGIASAAGGLAICGMEEARLKREV